MGLGEWDGRGGMPLVSSTGVAMGVRTVVVDMMLRSEKVQSNW